VNIGCLTDHDGLTRPGQLYKHKCPWSWEGQAGEWILRETLRRSSNPRPYATAAQVEIQQPL